LIFKPRGKSPKSQRYVPLTERVEAALLMRKEGVNEGMGVLVKHSPSRSPTTGTH
jgi:hypothetical protein